MLCMSRHIAIALALFAAATIAGASFPSKELIIPAAGRVEGVGGASFYTSLWITNATSQRIDYELQFLKAGQNNSTPVTFNDSIGAGATKVYENVAATVFGVVGTMGAIRIRSNGELLASARLYQHSPLERDTQGRGLVFSAVPSDFGIGRGQSSMLQGADRLPHLKFGVDRFQY